MQLSKKYLSNKKFVKVASVVVFIIAIFIFGYVSGASMSTTTHAADVTSGTNLLDKVKQTLSDKFIFWKASSTMPTDADLQYGMIKGYVSAYGDPYTIFFPPKDAKSFSENVKGSFGGVGMNVGEKDGRIVVIAPLKDSPAMKAGIKAGDIIASVDGHNVLGQPSDEAVSLIRGEIGKSVKITVLHPGAKSTVDITIVRAEIKIPTIDSETKNGVYIIHLYNFSADSAELFRQALLGFATSTSNDLIIDLRGNPGGYLDSAVDIASFFLPEGKIVVFEKQGKNEDRVDHRSKGFNSWMANKNVKIGVLIDGGSASASEILSGALKDYNVAKIVGTKSFGKGSVQELVNFDDGSSLKVTVAKWYTPNGVSISENGIVPDVIAEATTTMKDKKGNILDSQIYKAIDVVKGIK